MTGRTQLSILFTAHSYSKLNYSFIQQIKVDTSAQNRFEPGFHRLWLGWSSHCVTAPLQSVIALFYIGRHILFLRYILASCVLTACLLSPPRVRSFIPSFFEALLMFLLSVTFGGSWCDTTVVLVWHTCDLGVTHM